MKPWFALYYVHLSVLLLMLTVCSYILTVFRTKKKLSQVCRQSWRADKTSPEYSVKVVLTFLECNKIMHVCIYFSIGLRYLYAGLQAISTCHPIDGKKLPNDSTRERGQITEVWWPTLVCEMTCTTLKDMNEWEIVYLKISKDLVCDKDGCHYMSQCIQNFDLNPHLF